MEDLEIINKNYPLFKNGTSNREIRHNFFSKIETEIQAYLLGFIFADGCINLKRHTLSIHINDKDYEIFNLFKIISPNAYIDKSGPYVSIKKIRGRKIKNLSSIRLAIASKILINDLMEYGVCERKTYSELHIPNIKDELIPHFIRGYFDGDGSFSYGSYPPNCKNREKSWKIRVHWSICSKTNSILIDFQKFLLKNNINTHIYYCKRDDMYVVNTSSKTQVKLIYNLINKNARYFLSRKQNKFNYYVNTEDAQLIASARNAQEVNVNESNNPPKSSGHPISKGENVR